MNQHKRANQAIAAFESAPSQSLAARLMKLFFVLGQNPRLLLLSFAASLVAVASSLALFGFASLSFHAGAGWFLSGALALVFFRALSLLRTLARYLERLFGHAVIFHAQAEVRSRLYALLMRMPFSKLPRESADDFPQRFLSDVDALELLFLRALLPLYTLALAAVLIFALLVPLSGVIAGLWSLWLLCFVLLMWRAVKISMRDGARVRAASLALSQNTVAVLASRQDLRALGQSDAVAGMLEQQSTRLKALEQQITAQSENGEFIIGFLNAALPLLALALAFQDPKLLPASLLLLMAALFISELSGVLAAALAHSGKALESVTRLPDFTKAQVQEDFTQQQPSLALPFEQSITLKTPQGRIILQDFPLTIAAGDVIALMGPSGVGKSSLLLYLAGLEQTGEPRAFYCPQDSALIAASLADNLDYGQPLHDEARLRAQLQQIELASLLEHDQGLQQWLGSSSQDQSAHNQSGRILSFGQARRIALARALNTTHELVLLDEPVEHLDADQRLRVLSSVLAALKAKQKTVIYACHRPEEAELSARVIRLGA